MMQGNIPEEFADTQIMSATGWTWQELQNTPADEVELMVTYLAVKNTREGGGNLNFGTRTEGIGDDAA